MTRRDLLQVGAAGWPLMAKAQARRPNVLLINTDDQRWDTIRALGNREIQTPNFDSLVKLGVTFSNVYCQGSMVGAVCLPSRTMLMTGRSIFRIPDRNAPAGNIPLLPTTFQKAGYSTFHSGKRGNTYLAASEAFQKTLYSEKLTDNIADQSERNADVVIEYIRSRKKDEPFFVYLAPPVPHDPRLAPKKFMDLYDPAKLTLPKNFMPKHPFDNGDLDIRDELLAPIPRTEEDMRRHLADYYATITCLDFHVGRILATLDETGQRANTVIVFTSDQGLAVGGRHGLMGKQNLYEDVKPPMIITGPGIRRGQSAALVYHFDLFPTLCDLAGIATPEGLEGASLAPVIRGEKKAVRETLFAVYKDVQRMVRDERWKLIWYPKVKRFQLFDLKQDPWEIADLSEKPEHKGTFRRLAQQMAVEQEKFDDRAAPRLAL